MRGLLANRLRWVRRLLVVPALVGASAAYRKRALSTNLRRYGQVLDQPAAHHPTAPAPSDNGDRAAAAAQTP